MVATLGSVRRPRPFTEFVLDILAKIFHGEPLLHADDLMVFSYFKITDFFIIGVLINSGVIIVIIIIVIGKVGR